MHLVEQRGNATIIHVHEDLDTESSSGLASLIRLAEGNSGQRIVVSLESCKYCYSAGLAVLTQAHHRIGANFFVVIPSGSRIRRLFEITGLSKVLQIAPTLKSAFGVEWVAAAG